MNQNTVMLPDGSKATLTSSRNYRFCVAEMTSDGKWHTHRWTITKHQAEKLVRKLTDPYATIPVQSVIIIESQSH